MRATLADTRRSGQVRRPSVPFSEMRVLPIEDRQQLRTEAFDRGGVELVVDDRAAPVGMNGSSGWRSSWWESIS